MPLNAYQLTADLDVVPTHDPVQRRRAARAVASAARDAQDCRRLLEALGLHPADGLDEAASHRNADGIQRTGSPGISRRRHPVAVR